MKIFGIGLSKTGTSSLAHALEILGYRVKDYPGIERYTPGDLSCIDPALLEQYDALTDTPIPSFYRELDRAYPGAKFILTVREREGWLKSCQKQFTEKLAAKQNEAHNRLFLDLYGTTVYDAEKFAAGHDRFVAGVKEYFRDRPQDLLILDITGGEGWEKLCPFLGRPVPDIPFPKANVTRIRWLDIHGLEREVRSLAAKLAGLERGQLPARGAADCLGRLPAMLRLALAGGTGPARERAEADLAQRLGEALGRIISGIPVVSRLDGVPTATLRKSLNHFWLVDPLDGATAWGVSQGQYSVNVALIEDGRPVAGIVHLPRSGLSYSAMVGKGVFRTDQKGTQQRLEAVAPGQESLHSVDPSAGSRAWALCQAVLAGSPAEWPDLSEWQAAAPHALARLLGRRLVREDGGELEYGRGDGRLPAFRIE